MIPFLKHNDFELFLDASRVLARGKGGQVTFIINEDRTFEVEEVVKLSANDYLNIEDLIEENIENIIAWSNKEVVSE